MERGIQNAVRAVRARLGMSQADLARAAGVARQTVSGLEAGQYAPSAAVALRLARALGCRVEELFWLDDDLPEVEAIPVQGTPAGVPLRFALARVADRWAAHPLHGDHAFREEAVPADAAGTLEPGGARLRVRLLDNPETLARTVAVAGCTPALSLWARSAERWHPGLRVLWTHANSMEALGRLARGEVHAAGVHLCDPSAGEDNTPFVRRALGGRPAVLVNLGVWDEGLLVAPGNPQGIRQAGDLVRPGVRIVNREPGAGARLLLEQFLRDSGVAPTEVAGWEDVAHSHQEVARRVAAGIADAGASTASLAAAYGLGFVPLRQVRYDLAVLAAQLEEEPVRQLLSTLHHQWIRRQLQVLGGYDTALAGEVVATLKEE